MDLRGVLPDPTLPRVLSKLVIELRPGVHVTLRSYPWRDFSDGCRELLEPAADHRVVIAGPGILGDSAPRGGCPDPGRKPRGSRVPGPAPGVSRAMEVNGQGNQRHPDPKSTRLDSSPSPISYAVFS